MYPCTGIIISRFPIVHPCRLGLILLLLFAADPHTGPLQLLDLLPIHVQELLIPDQVLLSGWLRPGPGLENG
ncbi:hypothetical protein V8F20_012139 [Naviculisporaceae sp. PSN 640]